MTTVTPVSRPSWTESLRMCSIQQMLLSRHQNNRKLINFHYFRRRKTGGKEKDRDGIDLAGMQMERWVKVISKYKPTETEIGVLVKDQVGRTNRRNIRKSFCCCST